MGLRFRKSVSLCKGVKLNFGKTGMSVSLGTKGYHKTISTSGKVTTSVGIPGTGIYYTDSKKIGGRAKSGNSESRTRNVLGGTPISNDSGLDRYDDIVSMDSIYGNEPEYVEIPEVKRSVDYQENINGSTNQSDFSELIGANSDDIPWNYSDEESAEKSITLEDEETPKVFDFSDEDLRNIYRYCDPTIEWTEIISGATATDLLMDEAVWTFCKSIAPEVLSGNIDAYLNAIEKLRPVDDLLLYCGDFEFGTDSPSYIEVEFSHNAKELMKDGVDNRNFEKFIYAVSIRVARDLMALLPINKVIVHVVDDGVTVLSGIYDRTTINRYYNLEIDELIKMLKHSINRKDGKLMEVQRFSHE